MDPFLRPQEQLLLLVHAGMSHIDLEEEAVQLGFGQSVGALVLDRVLRGHDHEGNARRMRDPVHGHLPFFHHLEERALRFGRCPVDLVHQHDIAEDGAGLEGEGVGARVECWCHASLGIRSGVNWMLLKPVATVRARSFAASVFATPGMPCEHMPITEQNVASWSIAASGR